jgi:protein ImuB
VASVSGGQRLASVNELAHRAGVHPGMRLADARALLPGLLLTQEDPAADRRLLEKLANWCDRYTPWVALDDTPAEIAGPGGGLWLDITGCAHLFGNGAQGEKLLFDDLTARLQGFGFSCRAALADTPGAAWAAARYSERRDDRLVAPGGQRSAIGALPVTALRLSADNVETLHRLGLRRVADLYPLPRAPLVQRFGADLVMRLDQALGRQEETIEPRRPAPPFRCRMAFAEPIGRPEDIAAATGRLLAALCGQLESAGMGARRIELSLHRVDGSLAHTQIGTSRPNRDPDHLMRLFNEPLGQLDSGFGVELMILAARVAQPLSHRQAALPGRQVASGQVGDEENKAIGELVDRLSGRLGAANVIRLLPQQSHLPERAQQRVAAHSHDLPTDGALALKREWLGFAAVRALRPVRLLAEPEPIDVIAPVPDDPPLQFRWRQATHRVVRVDGPERLANEWWREASAVTGGGLATTVRDYYRIETDDGQRYWVYRDGPFNTPPAGGRTARWYLHGLCA